MTDGGTDRTPGGLLLIGALVIGLAIRLGVAFTESTWFDEATVGLMARDVLLGQFPIFFYGQTFMGAVDGYLQAVGFALLGESLTTLRLGSVVVTLIQVAVAALLARRVFGAWRWAAVLTLVPAPYLLKWSGDVRLVYSLVLVLTPLCVLLTLAAGEKDRLSAGRTRALLTLALVAGFCVWMNLLVAPVLLACVLTLALLRPRVGWAALVAPLVFLLGCAPVWLFAATYARVPILSVPRATPRQAVEHAGHLLVNALPLMAGVPEGLVAVRPISIAVLVVVVAALALALSDRRADGAGRLALGFTTLTPLAAVLASERGQALASEDPRYLLAVLAVLPVLLAGMLGRIARRNATLAAVVGAVLVLAQGAASVMAYPQLRSLEAWRARRAAFERPLMVTAALVERGLSAIYTHDPDVLNFMSGGRVTVSHFYLADDPVRASRVDASPQVAYRAAGQSLPGFEESLAAAGIQFDRQQTALGPLLTNFRVEPEGLREIAPAGWTATAWPRPELAGHAIDRDAATRWRTTTRSPDAWFEVDLGGVHTVGMVAWLPGSYQEVPVGFRLETSLDGVHWAIGREVAQYYGPLYWAAGHPMGRVRWGRVEVRFPARPARYVRVTHLGHDERFPWTIRELFVYEAGGPAASATDARVAAAALVTMGVRRVYADHGEGPRLVEAASAALLALPDNVRVDRYGLMPPLDQLPFLVPAPDAAVAYPLGAPSGGAIEATLRFAGVGFTATEAGGYRLLGRLEPARLPGRLAQVTPVRVTAEPAGDDSRAAMDGRVETRWSTRTTQAPGQWLEVELATPTELSGLELDLGGAALEYPRGLSVRVALDGSWRDVEATIHWIGPLVWTGTHVLRAGVERVVVSFPPIRTRALRVAQTGHDAFYPWSVAELRLSAP
jgi:F5/8 type C domain-containing protein